MSRKALLPTNLLSRRDRRQDRAMRVTTRNNRHITGLSPGCLGVAIAFPLIACLATSPAQAACSDVHRICTGVTITQLSSGTIGTSGEASIYTSGDEDELPCDAPEGSLLIDLSKAGADVLVAQAMTLYALGKTVTVRLEDSLPTCTVRWILSE